jgi:uncharacterized phage-like protein YoqJ
VDHAKLDGYKPFDSGIYRLADDKLQLIDRGIGTILLAVIDDTLRRCSADMKTLAHFIGTV